MSKKLLHINSLYKVLGIFSTEDLNSVAKKLGIDTKTLVYCNDNLIFPNGDTLKSILVYTGYSELELKIRLGIFDVQVKRWISENPELILKHFNEKVQPPNNNLVTPDYTTELGKLYQKDCLDLMKTIEDESIDLVFADPPFNLGKVYESKIDDNLSEQYYLDWTEKWLLECIRVLKPGGSLFIYNIPYWQTHISNILNNYLSFRHWIAIYLKGLMPVVNKLHPSHYGLLYYVKGAKPRVFNQQKIPMLTCRHCGGEVHDYGGKKRDLDPNGLCIADVWTDINPVRHKKFKNRDSNELPLKLLYRIISLASNAGDIVLDPFGGSGTTYAVAEYLNRRWIGSELGEIGTIIERLEERDQDTMLLRNIEQESNVLFTKEQVNLRIKNNFWTYDILNRNKNNPN